MSERNIKCSMKYKAYYELDLCDPDTGEVLRHQTQLGSIDCTFDADYFCSDYFHGLSEDEQREKILAYAADFDEMVQNSDPNKGQHHPLYKNGKVTLVSLIPYFEIEIDGVKYQIDEEEFRLYNRNPEKYLEQFDNENSLTRKKADKISRDEEFYENNTYNKKYTNRSNDIKTIMLDEADYQEIIDNMKKSEPEYETIKADLNLAMDKGSRYGFESTGMISDYIDEIDKTKEQEYQLAQKITMSIAVLKNCDKEVLNYLENILIDKIFNLDFDPNNEDGTKKETWDIFEESIDDILKEIEVEYKNVLEKMIPYAEQLWNFSEYEFPSDLSTNSDYFDEEGNPTELLISKIQKPDNISVEDACIVAKAMKDFDDKEWWGVNNFKLEIGNRTNPDGSIEQGDRPSDIISLTEWFKKNPNKTITDFVEKINKYAESSGSPISFTIKYTDLLGGDKGDMFPGARQLMDRYTTAMAEIHQLQESLDTIKDIRKQIPFIKYTMTDEYKEIYQMFRNAGYTDLGDVDILSVLEKYTGKKYSYSDSTWEAFANGEYKKVPLWDWINDDIGFTNNRDFEYIVDEMRYMTVNEMSMYVYLHTKGVGESLEYLSSIQRTLDKRKGEHDAYVELRALLENDEITAVETAIKSIDGFFDGIFSYFLNLGRVVDTFRNKGKTVDEYKEEKLFELLHSFRSSKSAAENGSDYSPQEWNECYYCLNRVCYDAGEITEDNFKAIEDLYRYISKDSNAYTAIAAFSNLYSGGKTFGNTAMHTTIAALGKAAKNAWPGVGESIDMLCRGLNAAEKAGKVMFKLYDPDSDENDVLKIVSKGLFEAINTYYINRMITTNINDTITRETLGSIMLNTFCTQTLKNMSKTLGNSVIDIMFEGELDGDEGETYAFVKSLGDLFNKIRLVSTGEVSWSEVAVDFVDLFGPCLSAFMLKGKDFYNGGLKGAVVENSGKMFESVQRSIDFLKPDWMNADVKKDKLK